MIHKIFGIVLCFCVLGLAFAFAGAYDSDHAADQQSMYCEMVETYKKTNGQYGWPPYKGECK